MVKQSKLTSLTFLVLLSEIVFSNWEKNIQEELEQAFCKWLRTMKNDEEVYMQLRNIQQKTTKCVEVYYERLLKLIDYL
jgi:hypothetical protein